MNGFSFAAAIASGIIGSMGLGGGGILIIFLTVSEGLPQIFSQGINLITFIPSAIIAITVYLKKRMIKPDIIKHLYILLLPGAIAGYLLLKTFDNNYSGKIFGLFLIISGISELLTHEKFKNNPLKRKKP